MKQFESKDLVLKITGDVQASNILEFEQEAMAVIASIKTELVTDQDFAEAKENAKSCKVVETRIANAKQKAIMSMESVAEMMLVVDRLQDKFRDTRLVIEKLVKTEEAKRKNEITGNGIKEIISRVATSPVKHGFVWNQSSVLDAIKGKRSLEKMEEAVAETVAKTIEELSTLESSFLSNSLSIQASVEEYPGLFPDAKVLALSPVEVVTAQIESRIAKFKYDQKLKEEAAKRAEEDRIAKELEEAAKKAEEQVLHPDQEPPEEIARDPFVEEGIKPIKPLNIPSPPCFNDAPEPPKIERIKIMVEIESEKVQAVIAEIEEIRGVIWISHGVTA